MKSVPIFLRRKNYFGSEMGCWDISPRKDYLAKWPIGKRTKYQQTGTKWQYNLLNMK
jgi:hypothetical protein